jgi:tetratricopeptide (TPR) repeat protein
MRLRHWTSTALVTCLAFLATAVWPYAARAQQPADDTLNQAKTHFEAGKNAYNAGDYQTAIREFKAAEALRPSPILDYNIGLANEKLQKKRVAVKYYRRYLEGMPNAPNRAQVEQSIQQLEREIAAQPAQPGDQPQPGDNPPPAPPPPPAQPTYGSYDPYQSSGQPPAQPLPPQQPPKKKSYWWVALIVVGGVALLAGVVAYAIVVTRPVTTLRLVSNDPGGEPIDAARFRAPPQDTTQRTDAMTTIFSF